MNGQTRGCPPRVAFENFFLNEAERAEREALSDHIRICPRCRAVFEALLSVRAEVHARRRLYRPLAAASLREFRPLRTKARRRMVRPALLTAALLAVIAAGLIVWAQRTVADAAFRGGASARLALREPAGRIRRPPRAFVWSAVSGAKYYVFELIDDGLTTVIPATQIHAPSFTLPADTAARLQAGRTYIWSVEAREDDGLKIAAAQMDFEIGTEGFIPR